MYKILFTILLACLTSNNIFSTGMTEEELSNIPEHDTISITFINKTESSIKLLLWDRDNIYLLEQNKSYSTEKYNIDELESRYFWIEYNSEKEIGYYFSDVDHWFNGHHDFNFEILENTFSGNGQILDNYDPRGILSEWNHINYEKNINIKIINYDSQSYEIKAGFFNNEEYYYKIQPNSNLQENDILVRYPFDFPLKIYIGNQAVEYPNESIYPFGNINTIIIEIKNGELTTKVLRNQ